MAPPVGEPSPPKSAYTNGCTIDGEGYQQQLKIIENCIKKYKIMLINYYIYEHNLYMNEKLLTPKKATSLLGITTKTLQNWDKEGKMKSILYQIAQEKDINIIEMEVDQNHVHLLVQYPPTKSILEIV